MNKVAIFLLLIIALIIGYDIYLINSFGKYYSISAEIIRASYSYPMLPFSIGIFLGFVCGSPIDKSQTI